MLKNEKILITWSSDKISTKGEHVPLQTVRTLSLLSGAAQYDVLINQTLKHWNSNFGHYLVDYNSQMSIWKL